MARYPASGIVQVMIGRSDADLITSHPPSKTGRNVEQPHPPVKGVLSACRNALWLSGISAGVEHRTEGLFFTDRWEAFEKVLFTSFDFARSLTHPLRILQAIFFQDRVECRLGLRFGIAPVVLCVSLCKMAFYLFLEGLCGRPTLCKNQAIVKRSRRA